MKPVVKTYQYIVMHICVLLSSVFMAQVVAKDIYNDSDASVIIVDNYAKKNQVSYEEAYKKLEEGGVFKSRSTQQVTASQPAVVASWSPVNNGTDSTQVGVLANALLAMGEGSEDQESTDTPLAKSSPSNNKPSVTSANTNTSKVSVSSSVSTTTTYTPIEAPISLEKPAITTNLPVIQGGGIPDAQQDFFPVVNDPLVSTVSTQEVGALVSSVESMINNFPSYVSRVDSIINNVPSYWPWLVGGAALLLGLFAIFLMFRSNKKLPKELLKTVTQNQNRRPHLQNVGLATLAAGTVVHSSSHISYYLPIQDADSAVVRSKMRSSDVRVNTLISVEPLAQILPSIPAASELELNTAVGGRFEPSKGQNVNLVRNIVKPVQTESVVLLASSNPVTTVKGVKVKATTESELFAGDQFSKANHTFSKVVVSGQIDRENIHFNGRALKTPHSKLLELIGSVGSQKAVEVIPDMTPTVVSVVMSKSTLGDQRIFNQSLVTPLSKLRGWMEKV